MRTRWFCWIGGLWLGLLAVGYAQPRVVFLGDSLTAGFGLVPGQAFPELLAAALTNAGRPIEAVNAGLSGDTTAGGLRRLDWLLRQPVDVLVVALGGNDALRGLPVEHAEDNLRSLLDQVQTTQPGAVVLLAGMKAPPNLGPAYAESFETLYQRLADHPAVAAFMPFLLEGVGGEPELNQPDGIHPTAEGQAVIADRMRPYLEEALAAVNGAVEKTTTP